MADHSWNELYHPLAFAARDRFGQLDAVADLGGTLRRAAGRLRTRSDGPLAAELSTYLEELKGFEEAGRAGRVRLVAKGLRLCAEAARRSGAAVGGPGLRPSVRAGPAPRGEERLAASPSVLRGVGPVIAARLAERGLASIEDLLGFLPLEYLDRRELLPLASVGPELEGREITTCGTVVSVTRGRPRRGGRLLELGLAPGGGPGRPQLHCVWFRAHGGMAERFPRGSSVRVSGVLRRHGEKLQIVHPDIQEEREDRRVRGLRCRYPEVPGVAPRVVEQLCQQACRRFAAEVPDAVPAWVAEELGLLSQADALRVLHLCAEGPEPEGWELARLQRGEHEAHRRLVFDELFSLELAVALRRSEWERHRAWPCRVTAAQAAELRACFPFQLTAAQERVIQEILSSMAREQPMHRLLQGDVGSGKTAVAFAAAHAAMVNGLQAAVMAPTEILARQHFEVMDPWCRALGLRSALLTGETPRAARTSLLALADAGAVQLLVGTHALLARELSLPRLGVAVIDEQHRFGVLQRARLRDQGIERPLPHLLVMTATPIPRTLALSLYGDLDLSIIDEKPPGRRPPLTRLYLGDQRAEAYRLVDQLLCEGQKVFVVCPLIEESDGASSACTATPSTPADAVRAAEWLRARHPERRVGLVHGRLPPLERDRTMAEFRRGDLDVLVTTTVIEVGLDVPSANLMVVEGAERFGLAQLHQLRGRVGRGGAQAHCLLLSSASPGSPAGQRLAALVQTDDGFEVAEADLALRGPGEIFGTRQAGIPRLRFADLRRHLRLLAEARQAAARVLERDPTLALPEHQNAAAVMRSRWERLPLVGAEAG